MLVTYRRLALLPTLVIAATACNKDVQTATDIHHARMDEARRTSGAHLTHMVDNAILRDMSLADIHFIPHSDEISGVGEVRLNRMAALLNTYGGIVRYETLEKDEPLIQRRLAHVREYLELTGCEMERVEIVAMISGGRGLPGDEAVEKYEKGTAKQQDSQSTSFMLAPGGSGR
jgi:hypothetical protein